MAVTNFSPLLGLALPTTGDLSGTWGTTVNTSITNLIDSAVAGTTTLSVDTDVTLTTTNGAANQARNAIIHWTASNGATTRNITAPAQSKAYFVINDGTGSIVIRGAGPTTGVTIPAAGRALVAWNGTDFIKVLSNPIALATDVTGILPITNGGTGTSSTTFANLATNVTGTLPATNGGTGQSGFTTGDLLYASSSNTVGKLGIGTEGQILEVASGVPAWSDAAPGGVTSVTASSPLSSTGGNTPNISFVAPGTDGNVLTSTGSSWVSSAPVGISAGKSIGFTLIFAI